MSGGAERNPLHRELYQYKGDKMITERHVHIAEQMYSARRSLKTIFPKASDSTVQRWQAAVRKVMDGKKMTELEAMLDMLKMIEGKEVAQMWLLAAVVEMVEPS